MQSSSNNISKLKIEKEIYNTFEQFKEEKNILIAEFLNKLKIEYIKRQVCYPEITSFEKIK